MAQIIRKHNKSVINPKRVPAPACNCRKKCDCPLSGNCLASSVIYKAIAQTPDSEEKVYLGPTEGTWKQRNYQHKHTFNNRKQERSTSLSKFVWSTKDRNNNAATQDIMVNPEARPSIQQHNKEMHALLTGKTSHPHISRTAQAPEQKIRTHLKMPPRK